MQPFSQRYGFEPVKDKIQVKNMDDDLRNGLWNALITFYWSKEIYGGNIKNDEAVYALFSKMWPNYFKKPLDTMNDYWSEVYKQVRSYFFECPFHRVYSLRSDVNNGHETFHIASSPA